MSQMKRRDFLKLLAASAVGAVVPLPKASRAMKIATAQHGFAVGDKVRITGMTNYSSFDGVVSGGYIVPDHIADQIYEQICTVRNPVRIIPKSRNARKESR